LIRVGVGAVDRIGHDLAGAPRLDIADGRLDRRQIVGGERGVEPAGAHALHSDRCPPEAKKELLAALSASNVRAHVAGMQGRGVHVAYAPVGSVSRTRYE